MSHFSIFLKCFYEYEFLGNNIICNVLLLANRTIRHATTFSNCSVELA